ncbi:MAG: hypothetical protein RLZZ301_488 [Bacteroidota bacterium]|jgi:ribosomal protein S18 acetylase RimI-like enzyme
MEKSNKNASSNPNIRLQLASLHDLPSIERIARQTWPSTYQDIITSAQIDYMLNWMYSQKTLSQQVESGHEFYLVFDAQKALGFIALEWLHPSHELKVNKLYVLPQEQGKGFGKLLLQKALARAKETQCATISLQVNRNNAAHLFYKQLGFHVRCEADFDIGNGFYMNDYVMEFVL